MRALIAGFGSIARRHAANLKALRPAIELDVVMRDATGGVEAGLRRKPDLALICTPSEVRLQYLLPLLDAGIPCYVEKPLVATAHDARALREFIASKRSLPTVAVGCNLRLLPSLQALRALVKQHAVGTVVRASLEAGQWLPDWRPSTDYRRSYSARSSGGGVILDLIHELDMARWLFGDLAVLHAAAGKFSSLEIASEDTACILLGRQGFAPLVSVALDYVSRRRVRRYEVVGDSGSLVWDLDRQVLERIDGSGISSMSAAKEAFDIGATYRSAMQDFLACIGGGEPSCGIMDGLSSAEIAIQAKEMALG